METEAPSKQNGTKAIMRKGSAIYEALSTSRIDSTPGARDFGAYITAYTIYAWVYSAIARIAAATAGVPLLLFEQDSEGNLTEIIEHPILTVLNTPNKFMTRYELFEKTQTYLDITGNSFWELEKDKFGTVVGIYPLNTKYMTIVPGDGYIKEYKYSVNGKDITLKPEQVLHIKYTDPDNEYWGMSPLTAGRDTLTQEKNAIQWNKSFFENSARPDVIFHVNGPLNKTAFARMKGMIKKLYGGVDKAHSAAIIEGGVKVDTIGFAQKDVEFLNLRKYDRDEILAILGVPPAIVGVFESAIRANAEEQRKFFWETTMIEKLIKIETSLNQFFVPKFSKVFGNKKMILMFDLSGIDALSEATETKTNRLINAVTAGLISRNEARDELGYESLEGLDTIYIPFGMTPVGEDVEDKPVVDPEQAEEYLSVNPSQLTNKDKKAAIWKGVDDKRQSFVNDADKDVRKYFDKLLSRTLAQIDEIGKSKSKKFFEKSFNVETIYNEKKEAERLNKILLQHIASSVRVSGSLAILEIGLDVGLSTVDFNTNNEKVQQFIVNNAFDHATSIAGTTKDKLRRELEAALEANEETADIAKRIRKVLGSDITKNRAKLIAENEVATAFNAGRRFGTIQLMDENPDVKLFKVWISAKDEKVRTTHAINDEVSNARPLEIDKAYPNGLMYPKDPAGDAEEVINCRCVESYVSGSKVAKHLGHKYYRKMRTVRGARLVRCYNPLYETKAQKLDREIIKKIMKFGKKEMVTKTQKAD